MPEELIPSSLWQRFYPCGNPLPAIKPNPHDRILNLGSGAGVDAFMLMLTQSLPLHLINLDVVEAILHQGSHACATLTPGSRGPVPTSTMDWVCGDALDLPFADATLHWVILNGVLNLFPSKGTVLMEIGRVLIPGGTLVGADLCCTEPLPGYFEEELDAWAWCMSGACTKADLEELFLQTGFSEVTLSAAEPLDQFYRLTFAARKPDTPP